MRNLKLPDCWLAGGAVRNTVWQKLFPLQCRLVINDFDVVFFDPATGRDREAQCREILEQQFPQYKFDVKNQAGFGVWREWPCRFSSTEDGIKNWLHTATAVGIRIDQTDQLEVYAPYGLTDLFSGILRPTPPRLDDAKGKFKAKQLLDACSCLTVCG
jgi:uncharacterized protein